MERRQWTVDRGRSNFEFQPANFPRGVTLMEVLISIAVVAVGLLGVASLIPIGTFAVTETAKSDRSAALGRAAMHEVRMQNMLERWRDDGASRWYTAKFGVPLNDGTTYLVPSYTALKFRSFLIIGQAFSIDPLFATEASAQSSSANYDCFPFKAGDYHGEDHNLARLRLDIFDNVLLRMSAYTSLSVADQLTYSTRQLAVFNRIFTWPDDLIFDIDQDDPDRRPRQSFFWSDGANTAVAPFPPRNDDENQPSTPPYTRLGAQVNGDYTWMLTAEPDPSELPNLSADLLTYKQKTFSVSVVTFYKRNFTCDSNSPSERFVELQFVGTGIGGGDARLMVRTADTTPELAPDALKVKEGEWIMVSGFVSDPRLDSVFGGAGGKRRIAKWYKVIRVDDEVDLTAPVPDCESKPCYVRNVTLAGPDWDPNWVYVMAGPFYNQPNATIIDGAIGVYTTTVTVE